ncbi:polysaccharide deacetylase family protein [Methylobacterium aquaticum]|uniref:Chitooligosaccharide deacetylase n=1 Tax=Methylobacterium aquaticum TaxID=270351 RepID=A0A0J6ST49_9HYPH|nr:polysaccharide deacetylase [Methylobacterium aquaticum]KMO36884.1 ribulose-phosphate 3-epimerase [Methylobacterium aquaticum]
MPWMDGARCVVMLTFDFDAETLWTSRDPANWDRPGVLSQGTYGAKIGVPRILSLLEEEGLPGTFFVPGWVAEFHTDKVEAILRAGHEIGHHGYLHEWIDPSEPAREIEALDKGLEALQATVGVRPRGYRSPAGEVSRHVAELLKAREFLYDSSMLDDVQPYRMTLRNGSPGVVELPWAWSLDDAPYALFSIKNPRAIFPNDHILKIWTDEFDAIYAWGGTFNLVMHPQVIGRPSRLQLLRDFIAHVRRFPNVRFCHCGDVAEWFAAHEPAFTPAKIPERPA